MLFALYMGHADPNGVNQNPTKNSSQKYGLIMSISFPKIRPIENTILS